MIAHASALPQAHLYTRLPQALAGAALGVALLLPLAACSPTQLLVRGVADQLAQAGPDDEEDLLLARDAAAFQLKLSEAVLRRTPGHLGLAETVAGGFASYAYAFIAFEADRLEATDARGAQRLRERAARMYARARRHAMAALELQHSGLAHALANGTPLELSTDEVGAAYWAAASWAAWIALSKDKPDVVADLPQAVHLARLAHARQPGFGHGALASLMGSLEAARPGGSLARAADYFDQAIALDPSHPAAYVAKAEGHALATGDRAAFERLLKQALTVQAREGGLAAQVMRERAQWLLQTIDDRF